MEEEEKFTDQWKTLEDALGMKKIMEILRSVDGEDELKERLSELDRQKEKAKRYLDTDLEDSAQDVIKALDERIEAIKNEGQIVLCQS